LAAGYESLDLGDVAESTFRDLLTSWVPAHDLALAQLVPDRQKIDVRHKMPSLSSDLSDLPFNWQIKATANPTEVNSTLLGCRCIRLQLGKDYIKSLIQRVRNEPSFFLALGVVAQAGYLTDWAPVDRFRWYVLDIKQYCGLLNVDTPPSYIDVPKQNVLNLALFSLIWSAQWVNTYLAPLRRDVSANPEPVQKLITSFHSDISRLGSQTSALVGNAARSIDSLRDVLGEAEYRSYASLLAMFGSLRGVTGMLMGSSGAPLIASYCPEALGGSATLWLFSRFYHEFMRMTQVCGDVNLKLLPVAADDLRIVPRFFQASLFLVRTLYRVFNAQVKLVKMLEEGGGNDYSFYSSAIAPFSWIHLDDSGHISLDKSRLSGRAVDLEQIREAEKDVLTENGLNVRAGGTFGSLGWPDLHLEYEKPVCLFPPEDHLIEHPTELWSARYRTAAVL
jgi:hypothetical protein